MSVNYTLVCVSSSRGLQQYTARLANAMSATGAVRVTVLGQTPLLDLLNPSINTIEISAGRLSPRTLWLVARTLLARSGTVLHYQGINLPTLLMLHLASLIGRRTILTPHNVATHFRNRIYNRIKWQLWRGYDMIILHTQGERDLIPADLRSKVEVIPHGEYAPTLDDEAPSVDLKKRISAIGAYVLAPGFIRDDKNLDLLLQNATSLRKRGFELVVAGRNMSSIADEYIAQAGIYFDGFLPDADLNYLVSNAEAVVLPYDKVSESGILHQALSVGTPVVVSDIAGFRERITEGVNGLFLPSLDTEGLKKVINQLLRQPFNRSEIRKNHLSTYAWDAIAAQTLEALNARRLCHE